MDFGNVVCAVKAEEELQLGQLYFALPLSQLKHKLKPEEMAALAVKASSALNHSSSSSSSGEKFIVFEKCGPNFSKKMVDDNNDPTPKGNGRRKKFTAKLSSINE
ncbi:hypothetical protein KY290_013968 [Solanum tuberosum]|uniref:Uncharacterized protein n=1 Tax=Solanum tuberosum TaxID=4113 RepID=A0ABQ7VNB0_SOLTU|nr:hypothetical protein KY290_013968 [Solanum tuberosum]